MIRCEEISKHYGATVALNVLSLHVANGEIVGLLGINGAGKSTLIKLILGFLQPDTGSVTLDTPSVGYMPEIASMPETISPLAFINLALRLRQADNQNAAACLTEIGLNKQAWNKPIRQLSKGMRQRTALAFALAGDSRLLIFDEPMSGLDALGRLHLIDLLSQRHQQGATILICSHIVPDLARLTQRVILMGQGQILEEFKLLQGDSGATERLESGLLTRAANQ
ncbi:MAG: ABC transporter ATP-binding protein [Mariprofundaceae bacterium]|nr:ABC transporter ATP-binding protein [Mariprofundaceae bacterium]